MAADVFIYVDDVRSSAPTEWEAWAASQRTSSILNFHGLQDASRKRRPTSEEPGAWTGSVVWTTGGQVTMLTTQEKWDKTKNHLKWIKDNMDDPAGLDIKMMKSIRGFLVYVGRTYVSMVPYLKGIHATIDSWRSGRDPDGFKYTNQGRWVNDVDFDDFDPRIDIPEDPDVEPLFVQPVPRLRDDLTCLLALTEKDSPPPQRVRMRKNGKVMYGFGDASKQGFGTSIELSDKSVMWRSGQFKTIVQEQSSNYRELLNLVEYIEVVYEKGLLDECELFMFTDNSTAEAAYSKGTSKSTLLFHLVLRLRRIQMSGTCILHMIHVAGTRMIWQGTDGLSRGDRNAGVMSGTSMLSFVPLHLSVDDRSTDIRLWCLDWAGPKMPEDGLLRFLTTEEWYLPMEKGGINVWFPAPSIADVAVELMAHSIHTQPYATHVFICPRLMTARWMRMLLKTTDGVWRIPTGSTLWDITNHEPLVFAIYFPLSRIQPWRHNRCKQFGHEAKIVQTMFNSGATQSGSMLRQLLVRTRHLAGL